MMSRFRLENREHLREWEPARPPQFFTDAFWYVQLRHGLKEFREGSSLCLSILNPDETEVLGVCNYTNIVRGTFQACHLGYAMAEKHQGKGLMKEALTGSIDFVFARMRLHRIMANYLPRNERSGQLLEGLGFLIEGRARKLLKINGRWEDHILTSLINHRDD